MVAPSQRGERHAVLVAEQFLFVPGQDRVLFLDRAVSVEHRFGDLVGLNGAELPLEVADPQHEIGDGDGAGVESPGRGIGAG